MESEKVRKKKYPPLYSEKEPRIKQILEDIVECVKVPAQKMTKNLCPACKSKMIWSTCPYCGRKYY